MRATVNDRVDWTNTSQIGGLPGCRMQLIILNPIGTISRYQCQSVTQNKQTKNSRVTGIFSSICISGCLRMETTTTWSKVINVKWSGSKGNQHYNDTNNPFSSCFSAYRFHSGAASQSERLSRMPSQPFWALVLIIMISTKAQACKLLVGGVKFNSHTHAHSHTHIHVGRGILYAEVSQTNSIFKPTPWNCFPSLSHTASISVYLFLAVFLFYISTFVVHDIDTIAHSWSVCVCVCGGGVSVCRLIAQWAVKQASPSPFNLTFCALNRAALWQQVEAATSQNSPQCAFLIGITVNASAIFHFPIVNFVEMTTMASLKTVVSWRLYPLGFSLTSSLFQSI